MSRIVREFKEFLEEYKVTGLAVAFIIGAASIALVQSLVNNIIMPIATVFLPSGDWQSATLAIGTVKIGWGAFLSALTNFMIIAFVVFAISKWVLGERKAAKK